MAVPHPIPEALADLIAERFRALAEPTRIRILDRLREGPATVVEITESIPTSQQNVSKHLGVLRQAGLVERHREGTQSRYEIADPWVFDLCDRVCGSLRRELSELSALVGEEVTP